MIDFLKHMARPAEKTEAATEGVEEESTEGKKDEL